jgi:hypothetical protein
LAARVGFQPKHEDSTMSNRPTTGAIRPTSTIPIIAASQLGQLLQALQDASTEAVLAASDLKYDHPGLRDLRLIVADLIRASEMIERSHAKARTLWHQSIESNQGGRNHD